MTYASAFELQAIAAGVGDGLDSQKERVIDPLRRDVLHGNGAVEAAPRAAAEMNPNVFRHFDGAVGRDDDFGSEALDAQLFCDEGGRG